jgi:O-antigen/teichoic acid export membrane protein
VAEPLADQVVRAARSNIALTPVIGAAGLISSLVVVRALSQDVFALYALALSLRRGAQLLADVGTGAASSRLFAELQQLGAQEQARRAFIRLGLIRVFIITALIAVVVAAPEAISELLNLRGGEHYFLAFIVLIGAAEIVGGLGFYVLTGIFGHRFVNRVVLAQNVIQPTLVIAAALAGFGLVGILAGVLAGSLVRAVGLTTGAALAIKRFEARGLEASEVGFTYARVALGSVLGKLGTWLHSRDFVTPIAMATATRSEVAIFAIAYDWVHQVLNLLCAPLYSLLLPMFAASTAERERTRRIFHLVTRSLALVVFPVGAILLALFSSLSRVFFGAGYANAADFASIVVPALTVEIVLSGPVTGLMLAHPPLANHYARIKVVTIAFGIIYVLLAGVSLLAVTALMMGIRLGSSIALHVVLYRRTGLHVDVAWLSKALAVALVVFAVAGAAVLIVPGRLADLVVGPAVGLATYGLLVRASGLLLAEDAAVALRVLPLGHRAVRALTHG